MTRLLPGLGVTPAVRPPSTVVALVATLLLASAPVLAQAPSPVDTIAVLQRLAASRGAARIPLLLALAERRGDDPASVTPLADEVLALLAASPAAREESRARALRAFALQSIGDYTQALPEAERAERAARAAGDSLLLGAALYVRGTVHWRMADYTAAHQDAAHAHALLQPAGASATLARTLSLIGSIHFAQSELDDALGWYRRALQMGETMGDEVAVARAHNNIGLIHLDLGRSDDALAAFRRALAVHERLGPPSNLTNTLTNLALTLIHTGRPREGLPYLERALANDRKVGNIYGQAKDYSNIGYAHEKLGDPRRALAYHEQAMALRARIGDKDGMVRSGGAIGDVRMQLGDTAAAIPVLERSVALAQEIGNMDGVAEQLALLSKAQAAVGDTAGAFRTFQRYHESRMALSDSAARRTAAELETQYHTRERERELATMARLAASRRDTLRWTVAGTISLGIAALLLGVLYVLRTRAQRALAESEQRYRTLFETSAVPYVVLDAATHEVLALSAGARALCGPLPNAGRVKASALQPAWVGRALSRLEDGAHEGALAFDDAWIDDHGERRWTEVRGSAISLGGRAAILASVRDATDEQLREESRQREERVAALGVLAGGIAHDFNNALTAVVGHISLARLSAGGERDEALASAQQAAMGASRLTRQLLAFAKGGHPARHVIDVGAALRDAVRLSGAGSHMRVDLEVAADLWHASLDAGQFAQVVSNIVINAQQATGEGGVLRVRASNQAGILPGGDTASEGRWVRIDFSDNGAGIAEEVQHRVFDPYFSTRQGGSGLGLATAYTICRNHGGTLTLESRVGEGSTFSAWLPATAERAEATAPAVESRPQGTGSILVLDDEPLVRQATTRILERWGYAVEGVADGRDAVRRFAERRSEGRPFDLLIMDLTIPGGMGGRQAMAQILALDPAARAIVVSGYSDDPTMAQYREAGFQAALGKPFAWEELGRVVQQVLGGGVRAQL